MITPNSRARMGVEVEERGEGKNGKIGVEEVRRRGMVTTGEW